MTPLHYFGDLVRDLLLRVPLGAVRILFVSTLALLLLWVLRLPHRDVSGIATSGQRHNLRPWAAVALLVQLVIYALL